MDDVHLGHRARLRKRFLETGLEGFAPHETLELLLTFVLPRRDTNPIAHALLRHFGSLHGVLEASCEDLCQVDGIGESAAVLIKMVLPLARQYQKSKQRDMALLNNPAGCKAYARSLLMGEKYDHFEVIALDARGRVLGRDRVASGDEGEAAVSPRKVISALLRLGAAQALIAHNHPGGGAEPSSGDMALTEQLSGAMAGVNIVLYDHIIIAGAAAVSFRESGIMPQEGEQWLRGKGDAV